MITFIHESFKADIEGYYDYTNNLEVSLIKCPYCGQCCFVRHGYYNRYLLINEEKVIIHVLRVKCKNCNHTHAILPHFVIPYEHQPIEEQYGLVRDIKLVDVNDLEEYRYRRTRQMINRWEKILPSLELNFSSPLPKLIKAASNMLKRCYLQIHQGNYFTSEIIHITSHTQLSFASLQ